MQDTEWRQTKQKRQHRKKRLATPTLQKKLRVNRGTCTCEE